MKLIVLFFILFCLIQSRQYNETESIKLAAYSLSSYCKQENLSPYDCGKICQRSGELSDVQFMNDVKQNLFGYVGYQSENKQILFVFRGSILTDKKNIFLDLDVLKTEYSFCQYCSVGRGFYNAYIRLKQQANQLFQSYKIKYPEAQVVVTGHSLGAALSYFFVADLHQTFNYKVDYMYTFGSPRLGNQQFANYFDSIIDPSNNFRVVKAKDVAARYPSKDLGYHHLGQEVYYDEQDNFILCQNEFDPICDKYYFWQLTFEDHQKYVKCTFAQFRGDEKCTGHKASSTQ